ncbi:MAG: hypothetical protein MJE12_08230 [Alphaproteobacteria bacterium]|nr:hypothetical protein [Alphaproteobacteria bacterium]
MKTWWSHPVLLGAFLSALVSFDVSAQGLPLNGFWDFYGPGERKHGQPGYNSPSLRSEIKSNHIRGTRLRLGFWCDEKRLGAFHAYLAQETERGAQPLKVYSPSLWIDGKRFGEVWSVASRKTYSYKSPVYDFSALAFFISAERVDFRFVSLNPKDKSRRTVFTYRFSQDEVRSHYSKLRPACLAYQKRRGASRSHVVPNQSQVVSISEPRRGGSLRELRRDGYVFSRMANPKRDSGMKAADNVTFEVGRNVVLNKRLAIINYSHIGRKTSNKQHDFLKRLLPRLAQVSYLDIVYHDVVALRGSKNKRRVVYLPNLMVDLKRNEFGRDNKPLKLKKNTYVIPYGYIQSTGVKRRYDFSWSVLPKNWTDRQKEKWITKRLMDAVKASNNALK